MNRSRVATVGLDAGERRIAARHLLISPILTAARQPAELDLVRRHTAALKSMLASQLGYGLIVESTFARLVKAPCRLSHRSARDAGRLTTALSRRPPTCILHWPAAPFSRQGSASRYSSPHWLTRFARMRPSSRS
jgi:hypothetical protein